MSEYLLPCLITVLLWWAGTVVVLYLDGLPRRTYPVTMLVAVLAGAAGLVAVWFSRDMSGAAGIYLGFLGAFALWGCNEVAFLLGYVTGPRRHACPPGCSGRPHFLHAVEAIAHHELALMLSALALVLMLAGSGNPVAAQTFLLLWIMRLSAKLNVYLGVRNLSEEFLPPHLEYLKSFLRRRRMNALWPFSVVLPSIVIYAMLEQAAEMAPGSGAQVALCCLSTLLALAVLEHLLMILPIDSSVLWKLGMQSRQAASAAKS